MSYDNDDAPAGTPAHGQDRRQDDHPPACDVAKRQVRRRRAPPRIAAFKKEIGDAIKAAGYPAKAKPIEFMSGQWWTIVAILTILVIYVTMVYGPIAAMLVELFPTRIRYTSMSLPYHIGNGWFGGLLPTTAFAIVAQTGNMYNGLWYPIIIAAMTFVIGMLFVRETKDVDIYAQRSLTSRRTLPGPAERRPFFMVGRPARAVLDAQAKSAACCSRSRFFCTLPIALRGSSATTKHRLGHLEVGDASPSARRRSRRRRARAGARDDDRDDRLAEVGMRHADHRALGDAGHLVDVALDLGRDRRCSRR